MKNSQACNEIDQLIYLTDDEMSPQEIEVLAKHLATCNSCLKTRAHFLSTRQKVVKIIVDQVYPDFTASMVFTPGLTAPSVLPKTINNDTGWQKTLRVASYVSGIAAAVLIMLFIWEQSVSVYKISKLETRIQSIQSSSKTGIIDRLTIQAAFRDKEWKEFWVAQDINQAISDPRELLKIRSMVEKRIRSGMEFKTNSGNLLSNYLVTKKNILTYKNFIK
jgi:hypothetical protein